jgi:hypothetical protein
LDQDKALMYQREIATLCSRCRTRKAEWSADENAYVGTITFCEGCGRLEDEEKNLEGGERRGSHISLLPRHIAEAQLGEALADEHA